jgi:hypothetical protein
VGFQFGFAFVVAVVAIALRPIPADWKYRSGLIALLVAGIGTFFTEFLALVGGVTAAAFAGLAVARRLKLRQVTAVAAAGFAGVVLLGPFIVNIVAHIGFIAGFQIPVPHYRWDWHVGNLLHFSGMMDHAQYGTGPDPVALQYLGAVSVAVLLARAIRYSGTRRWLPLGGVLVLLFLAFLFFAYRHQEYTAHRFAVIMSPFAIVLLLGFLRPGKRVWMAIAALVVVCGAYPAYRMLRFIPGNYIRVTNDERQIGEEWIPQYVRQGHLLIDLPEDLNLFYGHYMYWEAMRALGGDEKRIVYSGPVFSFVPSTPLNIAKVRYILRRKGIGSIIGNSRTAASNARYELLELRSPGELAMVEFKGGFYGFEGNPGSGGRWMSQDGQVVVRAAKAMKVRFSSGLQPSPRVPATELTVTLDGSTIGKYNVPAIKWLEFTVSLQAGERCFIFHSSVPPLEPGNGDGRKLSVLMGNPQIEVPDL